MGADGEESDNLTGVWHGRYFYKRGPAPVFFTASLIETARHVTGATSEPSSDGATAFATVLGSRDTRAVSFVKTYDNGHPHFSPIRYAGTLAADGMEIEGTWHIGWIVSGTFLMIRNRRAAVSMDRKVTERVY